MLIEDGAGKFNTPALTICFLSAQVTIQPLGAERRLEASCGARTTYIEPVADGWQYRPKDEQSFRPLTKQAFADDVLQGLLA